MVMIPTYSSFILELPYKGAYQDEIDEMNAHCTANDINFKFN